MGGVVGKFRVFINQQSNIQFHKDFEAETEEEAIQKANAELCGLDGWHEDAYTHDTSMEILEAERVQ